MLGLRDVVSSRKQEFLHYANTPSLRVQEQAFAIKVDPPFSADATEHLKHCRNLVATDVREAVKHWIWTFRLERPYSGGLGVPFAEASQALAELPLDEDALYLSVWTIGDIAVFCEKIITADGFWDEHPGLLYSILTIIHAIDMSSQVRAMETGEKWATYEELMNLGATLVQTMWDHHKVLLDNGRPNAGHPRWAKALRRRMTQLLHILCYNARGRTAVDFDEDYRRLVILCWYHSPDIAHTDLIFSLAFRTLPPDLSALDEHMAGSHVGDPLTNEDIAINLPAWTFTEREIIDVYGLDNFLRRISITIREPTLLNNYLRNFLQEMEKWFLHPQVLRKAAASGVLASLRDAVERQALHGDPSFQWCITCSFLVFSRFLCTVVPPADGAIYVIRECAIVAVLARGIRLVLTSLATDQLFPPEDLTEAYDICLFCLKTFTALVRAVNMRSGRNNLRKILRESMHQEWYPALSCIRDTEELGILANPEKHASVITEWSRFGEAIGMDEEEAKRDHERKLKRVAQLCSWRGCQYHSTRAPVPLMACTGCGEVRYCSRQCQRSDWYNGKHKLRCRRLKDT